MRHQLRGVIGGEVQKQSESWIRELLSFDGELKWG